MMAVRRIGIQMVSKQQCSAAAAGSDSWWPCPNLVSKRLEYFALIWSTLTAWHLHPVGPLLRTRSVFRCHQWGHVSATFLSNLFMLLPKPDVPFQFVIIDISFCMCFFLVSRKKNGRGPVAAVAAAVAWEQCGIFLLLFLAFPLFLWVVLMRVG